MVRPQTQTADLRIHRQEQRYIADNVLPLESLLLSRGKPIEYVPGRPETETTTLYLDTPAGTWSKGDSPLKFRCRSYQDPDLWYFELKQRVNGVVDLVYYGFFAAGSSYARTPIESEMWAIQTAATPGF